MNNKRRTAGGIIIHDVKLFFRFIFIYVAWYFYKTRHAEH